jgi:hypothetical protein
MKILTIASIVVLIVGFVAFIFPPDPTTQAPESAVFAVSRFLGHQFERRS